MRKLIIKAAVNAAIGLAGGIDGIVEYALTWFNENVLAKITDKEEFAAYAEDVNQFAFFLDGVFSRHQKWMSEAKRAALVATINAVRELAAALADANVTRDELNAVVAKIAAAIAAWKDAK